jgi:hypothetical protein
MANPSKVYNVGDKFCNFEIVEKHVSESVKNYKYKIRYLCCGNTTIVSHDSLRRRAIRNVKRCRSCAGPEVGRKLKARHQERTVPTELPDTLYAGGHHWPHLGIFNK